VFYRALNNCLVYCIRCKSHDFEGNEHFTFLVHCYGCCAMRQYVRRSVALCSFPFIEGTASTKTMVKMAVYPNLIKVLEDENHNLDIISMFGVRARNYGFSMDMPNVFKRLPKVITWNQPGLFNFYCDIHRFAYPNISLKDEAQELRNLTEELFNLPLRVVKEDMRLLSTKDVYVISVEAMARCMHETDYFPHYVHISLGLYIKGFYGPAKKVVQGGSCGMFNVQSIQLSECTDELSNSTEDDSATDASTASSIEFMFTGSDDGESTTIGNEMDADTVASISEHDEEEEPEGNVPNE